MLKNILKLDGAQQLSKKDQKSINGGLVHNCSRGTTWCGVTGGALCAANSPCVNGCCIPA